MATLVSKIKNKKFINDKNIVKVAITKHMKLNKAIYFSRSPIPYGANEVFEHIGIYAYKINALKNFVSLKMGELEKIESLEQLRALENGIEIIVGKAPGLDFDFRAFNNSSVKEEIFDFRILKEFK